MKDASLSIDFSGLELNDGDYASKIIVNTLRLWAAPMLWPEESWGDYREELLMFGVHSSCTTYFDWLIKSLIRPGEFDMHINLPNCARLTSDEALFIYLLSSLQNGEYNTTLEILGRWLPPEMTSLTLQFAEKISSNFRKCDLKIRSPFTDGFPVTSQFRPCTVEPGQRIH